MKLENLVKRRLAELHEKQQRLVRAWDPYIKSVDAYLQKNQNRSLSTFDKTNIAQCLENALTESAIRNRSKLLETTTADNIEFMAIQLPVIAALLPSLVLNKVAVVQALDLTVHCDRNIAA